MLVKFSGHRHSLQIALWVDGQPMLDRELVDAPLVIGDDERCTLWVEGTKPLTLLLPVEGGFGLRLGPGLDGKLRAAGRTLRVKDGLLCDPRPEPLIFRDGDRGALRLNARLQLRFTVHQQRRAFVAPWLPRDPRLAAALAVATFVLLGGALLITSRPLPPERIARKAVQRLRTRPAIFDRTLLPVRPPAPAKGAPSAVARAGGRRSPRHRRPGRRAAAPRDFRRSAPSSAGRATRAVDRAVDRLLAGLTGLTGLKRPTTALRSTSARPRVALDPLAALDRVLTSATPPALPKLGQRERLRAYQSAWASPARRRLGLAASGPRSSALTRGAIRRVVAAHGGAIRLCYERELLRSRQPVQGSLLVRWRIDTRGSARDVRTLRDDLRRPALRACILREIGQWHFPACDRGEACEVVFPFELFARS